MKCFVGKMIMKDKRVEKTLKNIENAFLDLLEEKKFQEISVTDICKKANINRCTFYAHFDNPQSLLESLQEKLVCEFLKSFNEYNFDTDSKQMIDILFKEIKENKKLFGLLFSFENQSNIARLIETNMKQKTLNNWLKESNTSLEEADMLFCYIIHGGNAILKKWYDSDFSMDENQIKNLFDQVIKYGLYDFIYTK